MLRRSRAERESGSRAERWWQTLLGTSHYHARAAECSGVLGRERSAYVMLRRSRAARESGSRAERWSLRYDKWLSLPGNCSTVGGMRGWEPYK